jgi:hypothetical protein
MKQILSIFYKMNEGFSSTNKTLIYISFISRKYFYFCHLYVLLNFIELKVHKVYKVKSDCTFIALRTLQTL